jgi:hypothetical protein
MNAISSLVSRFPKRWVYPLMAVLSFVAGLLAALMFSYVLFRIGLPSKPFIYVSF